MKKQHRTDVTYGTERTHGGSHVSPLSHSSHIPGARERALKQAMMQELLTGRIRLV
jgi:hypothetical protein